MMSARIFVLLLAVEAALIVLGMGWFLKHTVDAITRALLP